LVFALKPKKELFRKGVGVWGKIRCESGHNQMTIGNGSKNEWAFYRKNVSSGNQPQTRHRYYLSF
jgi:hypothetical protein